ncbi:MAG: histidinol dehydrogenase [Bacteroidales bacterium]|nr:histidinol dehydrogenase [Bacteroidales bacterium]MDT8373764.1 histidinol dehydrogenase [Bacteroidales bacterium]
MKRRIYPAQADISAALGRPPAGNEDIDGTVREVLDMVRAQGDAALREFSQKFDGYAPASFRVSEATIKEAGENIAPELREAMRQAYANISSFHSAQLQTSAPVITADGVKCWSRDVPVEKVGLYIPGGTAPLFSTVLMLAIPARLAGCRDIIICTPPGREGRVSPLILHAASLAGVTDIYTVGGAQAIAAMAYGTESIPAVHKIFGPGNSYVTRAKELVQLEGTAIDMPAGPSELLVIADESANAPFVAADLLSQAEHGTDSQVIMLTDSKIMMDRVEAEIEKQAALLERNSIAMQSLENSSLILLETIDECLEVSNRYAPEHLILAIADAHRHAAAVVNAGSVFLGNYSSESTGDYMTGPNHTLPTGGYARSYSGLSTASFMKRIFFQEVTADGIMKIGPATELMAGAEMLGGHRNAVSVRLKYLEDEQNRSTGKA